ncbi:TonB family C-terminal domain-containing protein [Granulicella pectinivorans]|uniref:TonB family C-terminal domain-containing protein n=2 Tax=Granulicella pectinivorans TaxID=474950 RepID=A0A1I6MQA5_9BACT|nr:TonB family C-terminal domain-containing protein [Granulicella pectinivorans]
MITVVLLLAGVPSPAQSNEADLTARLLGKQLYLRGLWGSDKLKFDGAGVPEGDAGTTSCTLSGIEIESVKLKSGKLVLEGRRYGIVYDRSMPKRIAMDVTVVMGMGTKPEKMHLEVMEPAGKNYGPALDAIFLDDFGKVGGSCRDGWRSFAEKQLAITSTAPIKSGAAPVVEEKKMDALRVGRDGVKAPVPLKMPDPVFSQAARAMRVSGNVLVYLWVGPDGRPSHIRVIRPLGLGLDESAVTAVAGYQFRPALRGDEAVTVEMNVEVNFQIF